MSFPEADEFNAVHGTQFIADLMPKAPIYVAMLPESAKVVMGQPHPTGRAALKMLENEGFTWDCYIDIFDGGPTVTAATDQHQDGQGSRVAEGGGRKQDRRRRGDDDAGKRDLSMISSHATRRSTGPGAANC